MLLPSDDAWAGFSPGKVSVSEAMKTLIPAGLTAAILSAGYNFDFIDASAIDRQGIRYSILVLPPTDRIPIETLRKIAAWADAGGEVIAAGHAPSLDGEGNTSPELTALLQHVFPVGNVVLPSAKPPWSSSTVRRQVLCGTLRSVSTSRACLGLERTTSRFAFITPRSMRGPLYPHVTISHLLSGTATASRCRTWIAFSPCHPESLGRLGSLRTAPVDPAGVCQPRGRLLTKTASGRTLGANSNRDVFLPEKKGLSDDDGEHTDRRSIAAARMGGP